MSFSDPWNLRIALIGVVLTLSATLLAIVLGHDGVLLGIASGLAGVLGYAIRAEQDSMRTTRAVIAAMESNMERGMNDKEGRMEQRGRDDTGGAGRGDDDDDDAD